MSAVRKKNLNVLNSGECNMKKPL